MLAGVRDMLIISTPRDTPIFEQLLEDGSQWGLRLQYAVQPNPGGLAQALIIGRDFLAGAPAVLILGDNLFYGHDLPERLAAADRRHEGATVFAYHVGDPERYGVTTPEPPGCWLVHRVNASAADLRSAAGRSRPVTPSGCLA